MMTFILCLYTGRYKRRLNLHVIYQATRSDKGWRIVDESGVLRDYHERYFVVIELPPEVAATFSVDSKAG